MVTLVAPLIAGAYAAFALGSVVSGGYHVGKALETRRYWQDYYRNTRRSPRYPFRVGYYDYVNSFAMNMYAAGFGMKNVKKLR